MKNKTKDSKRPFSSNIETKYEKKRVSIDCDCNVPNSTISSKTDQRKIQFENQLINSQNYFNNYKNFTMSPNHYYQKFKNQKKRKNLYNEIWANKKNDIDLLDLKNTIKISKEKENDNLTKIDGLTSIDANTRITSATTAFCDIGYTSKRLLSGKINSISKKKNKNKKPIIKTESDFKSNDDTYVNIKTKNIGKIPVFIRQKKSTNIINNNIKPLTNNFHNSLSAKNLNIEYKNNNNQDDIFGFSKKELKILNEIQNQNILKKKINQCNTTMLKKRTDYLIKYSKIKESLNKLEQVKDCFRVDYRDLYCGSVKNLTKYFDKCNGFLLNEIKVDEILDYDNWLCILSYLFNFCAQVNKIQKYFAEELHFIKNENLIIKQKMLSQDGELQTKNKELFEINDYILKYDLTTKIKYGKKKEATIQDVKNKYNSQEASYILTIQKLQEEINQLTNLLDQNKNDLIQYKIVSEKLKKLQMDYEKDKDALEQKISEKEITIKLLMEGTIDLNDKITELENEIQKFKEKESKNKLNTIEYESKVKNLNDIIKNNIETIDNLEKENRKYKEKKTGDGKMLEPVGQVFTPMKEKLKKRQHT